MPVPFKEFMQFENGTVFRRKPMMLGNLTCPTFSSLTYECGTTNCLAAGRVSLKVRRYITSIFHSFRLSSSVLFRVFCGLLLKPILKPRNAWKGMEQGKEIL